MPSATRPSLQGNDGTGWCRGAEPLYERWTRNLAVTYRPVNRLWRRGFAGGLVGRIAHEQAFPHQRFAFPQQALAVFVHLGPQAHVIDRAIELGEGLESLNQHDVAVTRTADALVPNRLARDLDQRSAEKWRSGPSHADERSSAGGTQ